MSRVLPAPPPGYEAFAVGAVHGVALATLAGPVRAIVARRSLSEYAQSVEPRVQFRGRGPVHGVTLPDGTPVVVRRSRHGGLLRAITGDRFRFPTRAPAELAASLRLAQAGVPTPAVVAYAVYPAPVGLWRSDVVSRRLEGADFPDAWRATDEVGREPMLVAVALLLRQLASAGAWHADLNLKNVFIVTGPTGPSAFVLDVDRVAFGVRDAEERNWSRFIRSARKWRARWGLALSEEQLARIGAATRRPA